MPRPICSPSWSSSPSDQPLYTRPQSAWDTDVAETAGGRSTPTRDLPLRDSISLRRLFSPLFLFPALPPRLVVVDRRLSNAVHGCLSLVSGCHAHLDQQREPPGLVIVKSVLRWSDHLVLPLAAWPLQPFHHRPHVVQSVDVRPDRLIGIADAS